MLRSTEQIGNLENLQSGLHLKPKGGSEAEQIAEPKETDAAMQMIHRTA
jgi:hypothetical protein